MGFSSNKLMALVSLGLGGVFPYRNIEIVEESALELGEVEILDVRHNGKMLTIDGNTIELVQPIQELVVLDERVIVRLRVDDYAVGDHEVGRNVFCYGSDGQLLWQIAPKGEMCPSSYGGMNPEAFFDLYKDSETGQITVFAPAGFLYTLNPETGEISDPVFMK